MDNEISPASEFKLSCKVCNCDIPYLHVWPSDLIPPSNVNGSIFPQLRLVHRPAHRLCIVSASSIPPDHHPKVQQTLSLHFSSADSEPLASPRRICSPLVRKMSLAKPRSSTSAQILQVALCYSIMLLRKRSKHFQLVAIGNLATTGALCQRSKS